MYALVRLTPGQISAYIVHVLYDFMDVRYRSKQNFKKYQSIL